MAKKSRAKTNAMRLLDRHQVAYTPFSYPETVHSASEVAPLLGVPASHVFKTLVTQADDERYLLVIVPGDREISLRLAAQAVQARRLQMVSRREAERLTGLKVGGISPLALLDRRFEIYLDASAVQLESLYINGGQRGINLCLRVADLLAVTGATVITATIGENLAGTDEAEC
jgi:Cys-tRNA(Pro)/Cys-tRNA(Cys) deacylase